MKYNGYHFTSDTLRDGRPVPPIGETLVHEGEIVWCRSGLYFSPTPYRALKYAPGPILHRVWCEEIEQQKDDKAVCRKRTIVASIDATDLLREFARKCALDVIHMWDAPQVVVEYLNTGNDSLRREARSVAVAAWSSEPSAEAAAESAALAASDEGAAASAWTAFAASDDGARAIAGKEARAASDDAAWDAWLAARSAARSNQEKRLAKMVDAAFKETDT